MSKVIKSASTNQSAEKMAYHSNAFYATRDMFRSYIDYIEPLSFEEWSTLDYDSKVAVLYVQFFPEILNAWYKVKSFYTLPEDGVSTLMQYLMKNVPIILDNPTRFAAKYIYKVAYNCLYCICHDIKRDRQRFELEVSNIVGNDDSELDLFQKYGVEDVGYAIAEGDEENTIDVFSVIDKSDSVCDEVDMKDFWRCIEDMDDDALTVVDKLIAGDKIPKKLQTKASEVVVILSERLKKYEKEYC